MSIITYEFCEMPINHEMKLHILANASTLLPISICYGISYQMLSNTKCWLLWWSLIPSLQHILWNYSVLSFSITLTHWGQVTHICVSKLIIIGLDNGLSPGRCQAIIWTNAGILLIGTLRTNISEISIEIHTFSFKKMYLKMSSGNWQPSCPGLNVLTYWGRDNMAAISQTTLSNTFSWMKMLQFRLKFHWNLFLRVQLIIFQHWFR